VRPLGALSEHAEGFLDGALAVQQLRQPGCRVGTVRLRKYPPIAFHRHVHAPQIAQGAGAAHPGIDACRLETKRGLVIGQRCFQPSELPQQNGTVVQHLEIIRLQPQRPIVALQRLRQAAKLAQRIAAIVQRLGVGGRQSQRAIIRL